MVPITLAISHQADRLQIPHAYAAVNLDCVRVYVSSVMQIERSENKSSISRPKVTGGFSDGLSASRETTDF